MCSLDPKSPIFTERLLWAGSVLGAGAVVAKTEVIGPSAGISRSDRGGRQIQVQSPS